MRIVINAAKADGRGKFQKNEELLLGTSSLLFLRSNVRLVADDITLAILADYGGNFELFDG